MGLISFLEIHCVYRWTDAVYLYLCKMYVVCFDWCIQSVEFLGEPWHLILPPDDWRRQQSAWCQSWETRYRQPVHCHLWTEPEWTQLLCCCLVIVSLCHFSHSHQSHSYQVSKICGTWGLQYQYSLHCALANCGAVYCNRSCLWMCGCVCLFVGLLPQ